MDDSKTVVYTLPAENTIDGWLAHERPVLVARCQEGKVSAYVVNGMAAQPELGEFHSHTVHLRIDQSKARTEMWIQSTDEKALFATKPRELLKTIASAHQLRIGFVPFNASPQIAEFNLTGFDGPYKEIVAACATRPIVPGGASK